MNSNEPHVLPHVIAHSAAHYSGVEIAQMYDVAESTIRSRWLPWLLKVAPGDLLKNDQGYTELARSLFEEFSRCDRKERAAWVVDAKGRYSVEWSSAGVIDGELMPDNVGLTLSSLHSSNEHMQLTLQGQLEEIERFAGQLASADQSFSHAELEAFQLAGMQRGLQRFKIEAQSEADTINALRLRRMNGGQA